MSFHHLLPEGHRELGKLLLGAAKAVFVAGMVALFYPVGADDRPYGWIAAGIVLSIVLAWMGLLLIEAAGQRELSGKGKGGRGRA